jgi:hypothetical protein
MKSPPAAATSSATHGWEEISGLPHSSQKTRGRLMPFVLPVDSFNRLLHFLNHSLRAIAGTHESGDGGYVGVNIGERLRCEAKKARARLQDFRDCLLLVGDCGDHQVWPGGDDLVGAGGPGIGDDGRPMSADLWADIRAIFGARYQAIQFADRREHYGGARLQRHDSLRRVVRGHD